MDRIKFLSLIKDGAMKIHRFIKKRNTGCYICFEFKNTTLKPYKFSSIICDSCFNQWKYRSDTYPTCRCSIKSNFKCTNKRNISHVNIYTDYEDKLPRNFRPRSPSYSPPLISPLPYEQGHQGENSNIHYDLFNAFAGY